MDRHVSPQGGTGACHTRCAAALPQLTLIARACPPDFPTVRCPHKSSRRHRRRCGVLPTQPASPAPASLHILTGASGEALYSAHDPTRAHTAQRSRSLRIDVRLAVLTHRSHACISVTLSLHRHPFYTLASTSQISSPKPTTFGTTTASTNEPNAEQVQDHTRAVKGKAIGSTYLFMRRLAGEFECTVSIPQMLLQTNVFISVQHFL
jgi:hypothetical protein